MQMNIAEAQTGYFTIAVKDAVSLTPINGATVMLYHDSSVVAYAITNSTGLAVFSITNIGKNGASLYIRHLSYAAKRVLLEKPVGSETLQVLLTHKSTTLDNVIVETTKRNDTLNFNVRDNKMEHLKVEQLLSSIPGVEVLSSGKIRYENRLIKSLLINGMDLMSGEYQTITKNLSANVVSDIQIIKNYSDNPVLSTLLKSQDVAVNLITKEEGRGKWNGSGQMAGSLSNKYEAGLNAIAVKRKSQTVAFYNLSNAGVFIDAPHTDMESTGGFNKQSNFFKAANLNADGRYFNNYSIYYPPYLSNNLVNISSAYLLGKNCQLFITAKFLKESTKNSWNQVNEMYLDCLLYTSPSPRD